jgi:uncharacterized protein (DUF2252 family)
MQPWEQRREAGKALRARVPRASHALWEPAADRPSALALLRDSNRGRQAALIPLRLTRMAESPYDFLRGAASLMAADLAGSPVSGLQVLMSGDAHLGNFGLYGTPTADVIFDLDDFDESTPGPWEWDLKRLTASINVAGRNHGLGRRERRAAVLAAAAAYRATGTRLQSLGTLAAWYESTSMERPGPLLSPVLGADPAHRGVIDRAVALARTRTSLGLFKKVTWATESGHWQFRESPPTLTTIRPALKTGLRRALDRYAGTLSPERRALLAHYRVEDVAHRVVGIGSVGLRAYLVLLIGNGPTDPLLLQIKEATPPCAASYLRRGRRRLVQHQGERIVLAHRALQATTDLLLGWTSQGGRP